IDSLTAINLGPDGDAASQWTLRSEVRSAACRHRTICIIPGRFSRSRAGCRDFVFHKTGWRLHGNDRVQIKVRERLEAVQGNTGPRLTAGLTDLPIVIAVFDRRKLVLSCSKSCVISARGPCCTAERYPDQIAV